MKTLRENVLFLFFVSVPKTFVYQRLLMTILVFPSHLYYALNFRVCKSNNRLWYCPVH